MQEDGPCASMSRMSTIETVAEVLRRLEALRELSVGALAEHLGQPTSTMSRLLKESRDEGVPDVGGISVAVGPADQDAVALDAWSRAWPNRPAR